MATRPVRITADDLFDVPVPDHLLGYELVNGQLVEVTPASPRHGRIALEIGYRLRQHLERTSVGGHAYVDASYILGLRQDPDRVRSPDVSYVSGDNLSAHGGEPERGYFSLVPDLAVEVDSPGRKPRVERQRIRDYIDAGVRMLWVIHTAQRSVTVYRGDLVKQLTEEDVLQGEDVLPGLSVELRDLIG